MFWRDQGLAWKTDPETAIKTWPCDLGFERSLRDVEGGMAAQLGPLQMMDENRVRGKIDETKDEAKAKVDR